MVCLLTILDADLLTEITQREKQAGIIPDTRVDLFMKVSSDVYGPLASKAKRLDRF